MKYRQLSIPVPWNIDIYQYQSLEIYRRWFINNDEFIEKTWKSSWIFEIICSLFVSQFYKSIILEKYFLSCYFENVFWLFVLSFRFQFLKWNQNLQVKKAEHNLEMAMGLLLFSFNNHTCKVRLTNDWCKLILRLKTIF